MAVKMTDEEIYQEARKRVEEKKGFFIHLAVYVTVNLFLIIIWWVTSIGSPFAYPWFVWPLGGWGIGVLFHGLGVFVFSRKTGWDQRQLEKEVELLRKSQGE